MKNKWVIIAAVILLQLALIVSPVKAMTVTGFTPASINNSSSATLTITGTDFAAGAIVKIGSEEFIANFENPTTLKVTIPAGFSPGEYDVTVINPDNTTIVASDKLVVYSPPLSGRPMVVISSYYTEPGDVDAGTNFTLHFDLTNKGSADAKNLVMTFSGANFSPLETGGVKTWKILTTNDTKPGSQSFYAAAGLWGYVMEPLQATINYTDDAGGSYTETFNLSIHLAPVPYIAPTATPTVSVSRPRLLVTTAKSDVEILQPGSQFELFLDIANLGSETARSVNMVVGGATVEVPSGTQTPGGGYSATGGDFTNFSPLGGSNVQSLGDINVGSTFTASQRLIVNVTTNPGAYTLKISFVYLNSQGETLVDDQVITLLVQSVPMVDISFYRDPGELFTFQPGPLPIQIVNLGKKSVILGSMHISASSGMVENASMQIGYLDTGGYLTQDAMLTADTPGEVTITVTVDYVDDFNQPQSITKQLTVNIVDMPPMEILPEDAGMGEPIEQPVNETFFQKVWRFIKGLLGLDSGTQNQMDEPGMPVDETPLEGGGEISPIPVPVKGP